MLRVGLTGGIGCGKSAVAEAFASLGVAVVDTDVIAHQLTARGGVALPAIQAAFGNAVFDADGALDRAALRRRVFSDADARERLEAILHPMILQTVQRELQALDAAPYALVVIPLLIENPDYRELLDRILVVDCLEHQQISRVAARSGLDAAETRAIIAAQASRAERLAAADEVLDNCGERASLQPQIAALHQKYLGIAAKAL
jgi:dephospho-CoA kinase